MAESCQVSVCSPTAFVRAHPEVLWTSGALDQGYLSASLQSRDGSFGTKKSFPPSLITFF